MAKNPFAAHEDAFNTAGNAFKSPNGGGSFDLHPDTLMPLNSGKARSGKIQSPAQHASVKKAAAASVARRRSFKGGL